MKKLMPSEGLRLGCSSGSTRCVIAKNYVLGQPGGGRPSQPPLREETWPTRGVTVTRYLPKKTDNYT